MIRPSERNKLILAISTAVIFSVIAFMCPYYTEYFSTRGSIAALLCLSSFIISFITTSIFQVLQPCPFNPVSVSVASASTSAVVMFFSILLYFQSTGNFLMGIVRSAFPFEETGDTLENNSKLYSIGYSYWMFWAELLPLYFFLGLVGSC